MNLFVKNQITEYLKFLKTPTEKPNSNQSKLFIWKRLLLFWAFNLLVIFLFELLAAPLRAWFGINEGKHDLSQELINGSYFLIIFSTVIIAPLFEEFIFRFPLKYKRNYIFQFFLILINFRHLGNDFILCRRGYTWWKKNYRYIFYFFALAFAAVHISNFQNWRLIIWILPLYVMPQFILGLSLGYFRVQHGYWWGVVLHGIHNLILVVLSLIYFHNYIPQKEITDPTFYMQFGYQKPMFFSEEPSLFWTDDSVSIKSTEAHELFSRIAGCKVDYVLYKDDTISNYPLNLTFVRKDSTVSAINVIRDELYSCLNIKTDKRVVMSEIWDITIADTSKLNKFINTDSLILTKIENRSGYSKMHQVTLIELGEYLKEKYPEKEFKFDFNNSSHYSFKAQSTNFETTKEWLEDKFGLQFKSRNFPVTRTTVIVR